MSRSTQGTLDYAAGAERSAEKSLPIAWGLVVFVAFGAVMTIVALASSSGPVDMWTTPLASDGDPVDQAAPGDEVERRDLQSGDADPLPSFSGGLDIVAGVLIAVVLSGVVILAARDLGPLLFIGRRGRRLGAVENVAVPPLPGQSLTIDAEAAREALSDGTPRHAIVACWIRLEEDAARVGFPRRVAETPSEYVERVVAERSVDAAPIAELADLYREARFSRHNLSDVHRARAVTVLQGVVAALGTKLEASS